MGDQHEDGATVAVGAIGSASIAGESDRDLELITDYLAGELDAPGVAAVERRLRQDEAFRRRAEPLMIAWRYREAPEPMPIMDERTGLADVWRRIRERDEAAATDETARLRLVSDAPATADVPADVPAVQPAPWWEVLPPAWIARVAIIGTLGVAGVGWLAYVIVAHRCHCL